ncbi:MAG: flagellar motor switch protein FliG [Candidatus Eisenbacteria bacterium]|uniref:Flagellar motor switch protein FliG n=1 Tax=Eiseniibacteriota bacterium TaxID=2212470 RepID=A0A849SMD2_UNCEI|nr:flagellar motor switch protein FliG [Candidatus Eisenbacteria bacterium]
MSAATQGRTPALTGPQKCAVICMALGPQVASRLLKRLAPDEVQQVSYAITTMPSVPQEVVDAVVTEFRSQSKAADSLTRGGMQVAHRLLNEAFGEAKAKVILEQVPASGNETLRRLQRAAPEALAAAMRTEHPQVVAVVLAHLDPVAAGALLGALAPELAADAVFRMASLDRVDPALLAVIESSLGDRVGVTLAATTEALNGPKVAAAMLNSSVKAVELRVLEGVTERDSAVADSIRAKMFTFEDLLRIDNKGIQRILRDVDSRELATALKGASPELRQHVKSNMSGRAAEALDEEIELLGAVRVSDVEAAHARVIEVVRSLEESNEIVMPARGGAGGGNDFVT